LKAVPVVGTVIGGAQLANVAFDMIGSSRSPGLPALPGNFPALPGTGAPPQVGDRGTFQNDPNIAKALEGFAISKANLKTYYRAGVKGYVVMKDRNGDAYGIPKYLAVRFLGYKSAKKPPISVGDWEAVKRADRTVKKVRKVMTTMTRVDKAVGKGGKIKVKGK